MADEPTEEQLAAARALIAKADAKAAAEKADADAQEREAREVRYEALRQIVESPAYAELTEKLTAIAPAFLVDGAHVPYLVTALNQVAGIARR